MRKDSVGFFWDDTPPPKPPKAEPEKRTPPPRVWLSPEYLPGLDEALRFPVELMSAEELHYAILMRQWLIVDIEVFENYFLAVIRNTETGKILVLESGMEFHASLQWILANATLIGFNSNKYDIPILQAAAVGVPEAQLKQMSDAIILRDEDGYDILRASRIRPISCDTFDLIEVAPLRGSLKVYAGRQHAKKMQDLPFDPHTVLTDNQKHIVRWYCVNDTLNTHQLLVTLGENMMLRYEMSTEYQIDLRSKSDAQIAEAVLRKGLQALGHRTKPPTILPGTEYRYQVPHFIEFKTPNLQYALEVIRNARLIVSENGAVTLPKEISELNIPFDDAVYRMGIGGLHSSEKRTTNYTDSEFQILDKDVTSYYPFIILNLGLAPAHLGTDFLQVYRGIVNRRIEAKRAGNKAVAQALKIVINGSFGKLGSRYSMLYAPELLIQVTITGQLSLLLFIEMLSLAGIKVISANTDGIAIKCRKSDMMLLEQVTAEWERRTGFETEETRYLALHSRDVNNYIAVKQKYDKELNEYVMVPDGTKTKGAYANPWKDKKDLSTRLHKNPTTTICVEAVEAFLCNQVPVEDTIRASTAIEKFVAVRTVRGGAVKVWSPENIEYVGKVVRWYYGRDVPGELVYAESGNKVPRSEGAIPCMVLPDQFPTDVDYDWYVAEAYSILRDIGVIEAEEND